MALKLFFTPLSFFAWFVCGAQSQPPATTQQNVTFRLVPVTVVERVSSAESHNREQQTASFTLSQAKQKWTAYAKKITATTDRSYALLTAEQNKTLTPAAVNDAQLFTVTKP